MSYDLFGEITITPKLVSDAKCIEEIIARIHDFKTKLENSEYFDIQLVRFAFRELKRLADSDVFKVFEERKDIDQFYMAAESGFTTLARMILYRTNIVSKIDLDTLLDTDPDLYSETVYAQYYNEDCSDSEHARWILADRESTRIYNKYMKPNRKLRA